MKYKPLGRTGLYVSELTLGAMTFASEDGPFAAILGGTGHKGAQKMIDISLEAGINIIDTSNMYSFGESEEIIGKALGDRRKDVVVATKVYFPLGTKPNDLGVSRLAIMREVENSLKRLKTDYIDLYQVHHYDKTTPLEETLCAMDDLVRQGKVRYIGLSNFSAWQIAKADGISKMSGLERFISVQAYYSLIGRELEREILPAAKDLGLGTMIWSPLAGGFLSGKYTRDNQSEGRRKDFDFPPVNLEQGYEIIDTLKDIAQAHDASVAQIALAWLRYKDGVTTTIIGATTEEQLKSNIASTEIDLTPEEVDKLDQVSALKPEYPHWMFPYERGEDMISRFSK